jgi:hypothetical protein
MRRRLALLVSVLLVPCVPRAEDAGLIEPLFVDGVMPPGANGVSLALGAGPGTYALPALQLDVALGDRAGASVSVGLVVAPGQQRPVEITAPTARFKLALLLPSEEHPGIVLGLNLLPSSREASQSEAGLSLGMVWRAGPATVELVAGGETRAALRAPEVVLGASVGVSPAARWRVMAEVLGEAGADTDVSAGAVLGFQIDARTLVLAGGLAGVTREAPPYAVLMQVKRDL